jgi:hypothetical protein
MSSIQDDVKRGVELRESGDPLGAIKLLLPALKKSPYVYEKAGIMSDIALCYQHLGNLDLAETIYEAAMDDLCLMGDVSGVASIRRQLSAIELLRGNVDEAYDLAVRARMTVVNSGIRPIDLCHITHGIVKPLMSKRKADGFSHWFGYTWEISKWTWFEFTEVLRMLRYEKSIAKYVWLTGYLADVALLLPPITYPFGALGYVIAKKKNLGLRLNQAKAAL